MSATITVLIHHVLDGTHLQHTNHVSFHLASLLTMPAVASYLLQHTALDESQYLFFVFISYELAYRFFECLQ